MPGEKGRQEEIARIARAWLARYDGQLLPAARLAALVEARLVAAAATGDDEIQRVCKEEVSEELFDACVRGGLRSASREEQQRQERAYRDLSNFLSKIAPHLQMAPGVEWTDLVQESLVAIHRDLHSCKQAQSFLEWATRILRHKALDTWRAYKGESSLEGLQAAAGDSAREEPAAPEARDRHVDPQGDQELLGVLRHCLDTDDERLMGFCIAFGLKRRELGILFAAPLSHWDHLLATAKRKLRECEAFRVLLRPAPVGA